MKFFVASVVIGLSPMVQAGLANHRGVWALDGNFNELSGVYSPMNAAALISGTDYSFSFDADSYSFLQTTIFAPNTKVLKVTNSTGSNGGPSASKTNRWTVAMDVKFDTLRTVVDGASHQYGGLLQLDPTNALDESIYTSSADNLTAQIWSSGGTLSAPNAIAINTWYRLVFTCGNNGAGGALKIKCYINGAPTGYTGTCPFNGILAMQSTFALFSDNTGELQPLKAGSVALWGEELSASDIAALGGPTPTGIPNTVNALAWRNFVGVSGGAGSVDGTGSDARFKYPSGVAYGGGNVYVADSSNGTIRKISGSGVTTTLAGSPGYQGGTDGTGSGARFRFPVGLSVESDGTVYVVDQAHTVRKVTAAGVATTLAGSYLNSGSINATGTAARFSIPSGIASDGAGNLYVADSGNHLIRKIVLSTSAVTTLAGNAGAAGSSNGTGTGATFNFPVGIAVSGGNIFVSDQNNHVIRKITPAGVVTTFAGTAGLVGNDDGTGAAARFSYPAGLAADAAGNLYVSDNYNNSIRKITSAGVVTTLAGQLASGSSDGTGPAARFDRPVGIAADGAGNVYTSEINNHVIRRINSGGVVVTLAGLAPVTGGEDGTGTAAHFDNPAGLAFDPAGNLFVADYENRTIRKITPAGTVSTLAGLAGASATVDGTGSAARFLLPFGVTSDSLGNLYVADYYTVRKITPGGVVTTLAGQNNVLSSGDGTGSGASFSVAKGITTGPDGNFYVSDNNSAKIRKVTPAGVVTTVGTVPAPAGIALNASGEIFVASQSTHSIWRISGGTTTVLAGDSAGTPGRLDGNGTAARFNRPTGLTIDPAGNLYVSEENGQMIRKVTASGIVTTLGGTSGLASDPDGVGSQARFSGPGGIVYGPTGILYVADSGNNRITRGSTASALTTLEAWRQYYFSTTANSGNAADAFDYDNDGAPNILEYAFGTDPLKGSSKPQPEISQAGGIFTAKFIPPPSTGGITLGAESSTTLSTWTPLTGTFEDGTATYGFPLLGQPRRFLRFTVSVP